MLADRKLDLRHFAILVKLEYLFAVVDMGPTFRERVSAAYRTEQDGTQSGTHRRAASAAFYSASILKEVVMATINAPATERRNLSDRRTTGGMSKTKMNALDWTALALLIVGGINWGLIGLINYDLVAGLFGTQSAVSRVVYVMVGLSALYSIYTSSKMASSEP